MELPFTITQMFYCWLAFSLISNIWLVIWAYGNWKRYVNRSVKTLEKYDDLDQDEKDFWSIP